MPDPANPPCANPDCPNARRVRELQAELRAVYRLLEGRRDDLGRCPAHPKGERCGLPAGHEGAHQWNGGD